MGTKAVRGVVVYWDMVVAWNLLLDYLLLLGAVRLAGLPVRRKRLLAGAAIGALCAVAALTLPFSPWLLALGLIAMCFAAFGRSGRFLKLTLLFLLLACGLGGGVLLLGRCFGGAARMARAILYAELPWGVFLAAAAGAYLLLTLIFRNGARHGGGELARSRIEHGGRSVTLTLFRDTGNTLSDPLTGEGVPVVCAEALRPLFPGEINAALRRGETPPGFVALPYRAVGVADGTLAAFRCDGLCVDGEALGARLIAVSPRGLSDGGGYQGLWCAGRTEHELETALG